MEALLGQVLHDRYQIQTLLGRKTGRRTFLAVDQQTQTSVVVKLLLFSPDFTWDDLKLFEREAETLKFLDHPTIPRYLDSFEVATELGKGFALVQSYIGARSLQDWVQSGRTFSEADLKAIAKDLLETLDYLHNRQPPVIHRDIKPSNILLGDRSGHRVGQVYLVDFGSVQNTAAIEGGTFTVVGTYGYMPLEQFSGRSVPASDLYSVGATLLYLATGKHPADFPQKDLRLQFETFVHLIPPLNNWLSQMIEPSVEKRFHSARAALQALDETGQMSAAIHQRFLKFGDRLSPECSKFLVTKTTDVFHWVVSGSHQWQDFLSSTFLPFAQVDNCFLRLLMVLSFVPCFIIPLSVLGALLDGAIVGNWFATLLLVLCVWGGAHWLRKHLHEFLAFFAETHFKIDRECILITHHLLGMQWHTLNCSREQIQRLRFTPKHLQPAGTDDNGKAVYLEVKANLEFWVSNEKYRIPGTYSFGEMELEWLAEELCDWLGHELQPLFNGVRSSNKIG